MPSFPRSSAQLSEVIPPRFRPTDQPLRMDSASSRMSPIAPVSVP